MKTLTLSDLDMTFSEIKHVYDTSDFGRNTVQEMIAQPEWITCNHMLDWNDIRAVIQGGCASGAYMPAVTYFIAAKTMAKHGDDVLQYIENQYGEIPAPSAGESWSGIAVFYLSLAVELWCSQFSDCSDWS